MHNTKHICILLSAAILLFGLGYATRFDVRNQCPYTVWAAAVPGGGKRLNQGETWTFNVNPGTMQGRIWGRTHCSFDESGRGRCETGDCGGVLECESHGAPPNTQAEYGLNLYNNLDFFDISLVGGFNVPMEFSPTSIRCRGTRCAGDINSKCPGELKTAGGCYNPCTVFKTDQYCCYSGHCGPTSYSEFFKKRCPEACCYPADVATSTFTCPSGTAYTLVFCP
ncbi:hypothetical protein L6164_019501 [Bauhinia variegata]|uniref:Uncharacterized protein n=1 Tax=Bauhinia variegata TaxID=167791 RepID=A0ACB9MS81_BAUVA|nr:hypothetical protein L6164_019501 [Bauhinia variegata]